MKRTIARGASLTGVSNVGCTFNVHNGQTRWQ